MMIKESHLDGSKSTPEAVRQYKRGSKHPHLSAGLVFEVTEPSILQEPHPGGQG